MLFCCCSEFQKLKKKKKKRKRKNNVKLQMTNLQKNLTKSEKP